MSKNAMPDLQQYGVTALKVLSDQIWIRYQCFV